MVCAKLTNMLEAVKETCSTADKQQTVTYIGGEWDRNSVTCRQTFQADTTTTTSDQPERNRRAAKHTDW